MNIVIREIRLEDFRTFSNTHMLKNMYQTVEYAELMSRNGYVPLYVGGFLNGTMIAASMILTKGIAPTFKYGYAPRGFLIDYYDTEKFEIFTKNLQSFLYKKNIVFVKVNPEITYALVNPKDGSKTINFNNAKIIDVMQNLGYLKLKDNIYFESLLPKYNPIINLTKFDFNKINKNAKHKILKNSKKGLNFIVGDSSDLPKFYEFIKNKRNKPLEYFEDYYNIYNNSNMMDLLLIEIYNNEYLKTIKEEYEKESEVNNDINLEFQSKPNNRAIYNKKMISDKRLSDLNIEIGYLTNKLQKNILRETIAGALVIKFHNRIYLLISGFDKEFSRLSPNYLMHGKIIEKYKNEGFKFFDLNGITGDFSDTNPYKGLNDFKLNFKPTIYEYIGEFDLVINKTIYQLLLSSNKLSKEFQRTDIKPTNEN